MTTLDVGQTVIGTTQNDAVFADRPRTRALAEASVLYQTRCVREWGLAIIARDASVYPTTALPRRTSMTDESSLRPSPARRPAV